jgi:hypothetical protein
MAPLSSLAASACSFLLIEGACLGFEGSGSFAELVLLLDREEVEDELDRLAVPPTLRAPANRLE